MKCIVIYQTKTGFTKQYAEWIQKELGCEVKALKEVTKKTLSTYDTIIFGSYIRIEKVRGWNEFKELTEDTTKNLVLFATGSSPRTEEEHLERIWKASIPEKEFQTIPHFYMQSGLNYEKMGVIDKLLMKGFAAVMKWKKRREGTKMSQDISKSYDVSSKNYIIPLVEYVKRLG